MAMRKDPLGILLQTALLTILLSLAIGVSADCTKDLNGEVYCGGGRCVHDAKGTVWCSKYYDGDAEITLQGNVLCGKGQCDIDQRGQVFCSSEIGGAVLKDSRGRVRCYGRCEPGTTSKCENTRADSG